MVRSNSIISYFHFNPPIETDKIEFSTQFIAQNILKDFELAAIFHNHFLHLSLNVVPFCLKDSSRLSCIAKGRVLLELLSCFVL